MITNILKLKEDGSIDFNKSYILQLRKQGRTISTISQMTGKTVTEVSKILYDQNNNDKGVTIRDSRIKNTINYRFIISWTRLYLGVYYSTHQKKLILNIPFVSLEIVFKKVKV